MIVRTAYLGVLIMLVMVGLLWGSGGMAADVSLNELAKAGTKVFYVIAFGQVVLICLLAPLFMSGAIAAEQSGKTFDILLTTPLNNVQIVAGLLLGRLFFIWTLLLSGLPLFSILLIYGGVPISSVFVSFAVSGLIALLVGAVAVFLAVMRKGGRKAVFSFVVAVAGYLLVVYLADVMVLRQIGGSVATTGGGHTTILTPLHPLLVLEASLNSVDYALPTPDQMAGSSWLARFYYMNPLGAFSVITILTSLALVLIGGVGVRSVGEGLRMQLPPTVRKWLRLQVGQRRRDPRSVWHNPVAWREANTRGKVAVSILARWGFLVGGLLIGVLLIFALERGWLPKVPDPSTGGFQPAEYVFKQALMALLAVEIAAITLVALYMSAGSVSREREDGTLDLVLTTPITPRYYVWGKLRGLVSFLAMMLAVPVGTLIIAAFYSFLFNKEMSYSLAGATGSVTEPLVLFESGVLLGLTLVPFVAMTATIGMQASVGRKTVLGAVIVSSAIVATIATVGFCCGSLALGEVEFIGPIARVFSPMSSLPMLLNQWSTVANFDGTGRVSLMFASLLCAGLYVLIIYGIIVQIISNFDYNVRKLSGER